MVDKITVLFVHYLSKKETTFIKKFKFTEILIKIFV